MDLKDWIGRSQTIADVITPAPYAALSATLDRDPARPPHGTPLPPLWHWLYFLPIVQRAELGPDGHEKRGGFLPPVPLPRRMWAGGQLEFLKPVVIGDQATLTSTVERVEEKIGRSGRLIFVTVRHVVRLNHEDCIREHQDLVYREHARPGEPAPPPKPAPATSAWEKTWQPDDVLLFRYSALTFNAHRIHYDRRYVTEQEGYPGLVVHGPLIATLLLDLLRWNLPHARVIRFQFRALRPLFDPHPFSVCGEPAGNTVHLWAKDHQSALAMEATAELEPAHQAS